MRTFKAIVLNVFLLLLLAFVVIWAILNEYAEEPLPPCQYEFPDCCLSFANECGEEVADVFIATAHGDSLHTGPVGRNWTISRVLVQQGETSYRIIARTSNRTIQGVCDYYEGGYWIRNRILPDTILVEQF
jgi:hypothetical protein